MLHSSFMTNDRVDILQIFAADKVFYFLYNADVMLLHIRACLCLPAFWYYAKSLSVFWLDQSFEFSVQKWLIMCRNLWATWQHGRELVVLETSCISTLFWWRDFPFTFTSFQVVRLCTLSQLLLNSNSCWSTVAACKVNQSCHKGMWLLVNIMF